LARETSNRTYTEIGVSEPHHPLTHHGNDPEKIAKVAEINRFHVSLFAEFLEKLKATPEGDGTLLDHVLYLYATPLANLHVTLLDKVGVRLESFADSNGTVDELFEPLPV
jgi:hypothetical protein